MTTNYSELGTPKMTAKPYNEFVSWVGIDKEDEGLPRLHFKWENKELIVVPDEVSNADFQTSHPGVTIEIDYDGRRTVWASNGKIHHRWYCNFRRYGWLWTDTVDGKYGYATGLIYANGFDGGLACDSGAQVIRETAISALWQNPHGVPDALFRCAETFEALEWLVADAIKNQSKHARSPLGRSNYVKGRQCYG